MKLSPCLLALLITPGLAFGQSQQTLSTPALGENADVGTGIGEPPQSFEPQLTDDWREAYQQLQNQGTRATTTTPVPTVTTPNPSSGSDGGGAAAMVAGLLGVCGALFGGTLGTSTGATVTELSDAVEKYNDELGFQDYPDFQASPELGQAINAKYPPGCENNFINKEGKLGPWGRTALEEIRARPNEYVQNEPPDVLILCKNYKHFDKSKREQFWVWMFSSLAAPESSCNPNAKNPNAPNGTAIGLFQLKKSFCDVMGVHGNLYNPHQNTRCAVRGLAKELARRDNLMSPTSKNSDSRRTYWGPLRTDDHNKARGGDIAGAKKFRSLVGKFPGCGR